MRSTTQAAGKARLLGSCAERDRGLAVHAVAEQALGVGQVDLHAHHPLGVFGPGDPRQGARERRSSRASTLTDGRVADLVSTTSRSGTRTTTRIMSVRLTVRSGCCPPSAGGADQGARVKRPMSDDAIERRDDLGVVAG